MTSVPGLTAGMLECDDSVAAALQRIDEAHESGECLAVQSGRLTLPAGQLLLLACAAGLLGFILSRWSSRTIGLIVRLLLFGVPSAQLVRAAFHDTLMLRGRSSQFTSVPLAEVWLRLAVVLVLLAIALHLLRREHRSIPVRS